MPPTPKKPSTPAPDVSDYHDSSSDGDYQAPPKTPVPTTPAPATRSPSVFKTQPSTPSRLSGVAEQATVKASKKTKTDSSKGSYAPVPAANAPPSDGSDFSDLSDSDPEKQMPRPSKSSQSRSQQAVVGGAGMEEEGHDASDVEQEEEAEGRPAQTPEEKRKRLRWVLWSGGIAVVVIIAIIVVIAVLQTGKSSSADASSHALNSTDTANSTLSDSHNSTSSHNSTLAHNASSSVGGGLETSTALPTNGTAHAASTSGLEEINSLTESTSIGSNGSQGLKTSSPTRPEDSTLAQAGEFETSVAESTPSATSSSGQTLEGDESNLGLSTAPSTLPTANPSQDDSANSPSKSLVDVDADRGASLTTAAPSTTLSQIADTAQPTDKGILVDPIHSNEAGTAQPSLNWVTLTPIASPSAIVKPIPSDYLRPAPQATEQPVSNEGGSAQDEAQPRPTETRSAWWPAPTLEADPDVSEHSGKKSTKWVGNATWFDPSEASKACQVDYKDSDLVVAISTEIYGSSSSVSTFCGAKVNIWNPYTNASATGTILGVCEDCQGPADINLSQALFAELDDPEIGVLDVQWWFDDPLVEEMTTADLSAYESSAPQVPKKYETTAIWWKETEWKGSCGKVVKDDSYSVGLPLELWGDASKPATYCGKHVTVKNLESGAVIDAEIVEASNSTEYTTFTKIAFEHLGGIAEDGELSIEFWFN